MDPPNNETRPCFTDPSGMGTPTEDDELATERWGLVTVQKMKDALKDAMNGLRHLFDQSPKNVEPLPEDKQQIQTNQAAIAAKFLEKGNSIVDEQVDKTDVGLVGGARVATEAGGASASYDIVSVQTTARGDNQVSTGGNISLEGQPLATIKVSKNIENGITTVSGGGVLGGVARTDGTAGVYGSTGVAAGAFGINYTVSSDATWVSHQISVTVFVVKFGVVVKRKDE